MKDAPPNAYIVIDGRRWRASDPHIPDAYRHELVDELMAARRAVGQATRQHDVKGARARVNDAKVALGERGYPWWLQPTPNELAPRIEAAIRALLRSRRGRLIYPTDVARIVGGAAWRSLLPRVRTAAVAMSTRGELEMLSRGRVIQPPARGLVRYRLAERQTST